MITPIQSNHKGIAYSYILKSLLRKSSREHRTSFDQHQPDCAVIAVIKDQGSYIHEFVHHYLYFGFKRILLLVNRTSDLTCSVLDAICKSHSEVSYFMIDWIDQIGHEGRIQSLGYAYGISLLREESYVQYVLLCDADEFWFPSDFKTPIHQYLQSLTPFGQLSICWANQFTHEDLFMPPFKNRHISTTRKVKSFLCIDCKIDAIMIHIHRIGPKLPHLDYSGATFKVDNSNRQLYRGNPSGHSSYILHRQQRSEKEYLALLLQGNPEVNSPNNLIISTPNNPRSLIRIKSNRQGYLDESTDVLPVHDDSINEYHQSLCQFIDRCCISDYIKTARLSMLDQVALFELVVQNDIAPSLSISKEDLQKLKKVLNGTYLLDHINNL